MLGDVHYLAPPGVRLRRFDLNCRDVRLQVVVVGGERAASRAVGNRDLVAAGRHCLWHCKPRRVLGGIGSRDYNGCSGVDEIGGRELRGERQGGRQSRRRRGTLLLRCQRRCLLGDLQRLSPVVALCGRCQPL